MDINEPHFVNHCMLTEWYDGFVSGIIQTDRGNYIAAMVYFDPGTCHRLYALIPLPVGADLKETAVVLCDICRAERSLKECGLGDLEGMAFSLGTIEEGMPIYLYPARDAEKEKVRTLVWPVIEMAADGESRLWWEDVVTRCPKMNPAKRWT